MGQLFSSDFPFDLRKEKDQDPRRLKLIAELEKILFQSPFLSPGEKTKMARVIPYFSNDIIKDLQKTLIRQNLRFLQQKTRKTKHAS